MIGRQEVIELAREFGLSPNIVEKDYILGWLLAGTFNHPLLRPAWVFKGGTCLKKCYFETYRFSEDLDFTLTDPAHIDQQFLETAFAEIRQWIYDQSGIELPAETVRFEIYESSPGNLAVQGRIGYRGPMGRGGDPARVKLDLTNNELLVREPIMRDVHHPYSDRLADGFHAQCYSYEEVFAEKLRALAERERPRDLYDVIHLYRHVEARPDRNAFMQTLAQKCAYKGIAVPKMASLENSAGRKELELEWGNMLGHQLPALPPFEMFWRELPEVFDWLHGMPEKPRPVPIPSREAIDTTWQPPAMVTAWRTQAPLEVIRFAAANRLCVELGYDRKRRIIEPYSLRRTQDGNLLLHAIRRDNCEHRSYRVDRIESAAPTQTTFVPQYAIELTPVGPLVAPSSAPRSVGTRWSGHRMAPTQKNARARGLGFGPTYLVQCTYCGKKFARKEYDTGLNPHKTKDGHPCPGRIGHLVETKY